ncbi:MAG: site-specific DNA-methyltransferase [Chitinophagaceae bacterium]|nr:MAG: site-specific DNA-methyltransferase [Chitinophagaceae bacterium]
MGHSTIKAEVLGNTASEDLVFNYNIHRVKSLGEIYLESQYYLKVFGNNQGKRIDLLTNEEKSFVDTIEGDKFDKVAALVGGSVSGQTLRRVNKAIEAEVEARKVGNEELLDLKLVEKLLAEEITPSNAENLLNNYNKFKHERDEEKDHKIIVPENLDSTYQLYNKSSEKMQEVEDESIQTAITSCPYYDVRLYGNTTDEKLELGHEKTPEEFVENLMVHFREVHRVLKPKGSFFLNFGEYGFKGYSPLISNMLVLRLYEEGLFKCVNEIIFHKTNGKPEPVTKRLMRSYEKIYHLVKDAENYDYYPLKIWRNEPMKLLGAFKNRGKKGSSKSAPCLQRPYTGFKDFIDQQKFEDVMHASVANTTIFKKIDPTFDHAAPYDAKICLLGILTTSLPGQKILDNFSGTASTGVAALNLGRDYVGFELNKKYHEFAVKRIPFELTAYNKDSVDQFEELKCS